MPFLPDTVVSDIRMPDTSGLELPRRLAERGRALPVIFVTTSDTEESRAATRRAGAAAFFHKPVDSQTLLDAIAWVIRAARTGTGLELKPFSDPKNRGNAI